MRVQTAVMNVIAFKINQVNPEQLFLCDSDREARDRVLLRGIQNPAHLFVCNSLFAQSVYGEHPKDTKLLFAETRASVDYEDITIAIKPEWKSVAGLVNQALDFLLLRAGFTVRLEKRFSDKRSKLLSFVS